MCSSISRRSPPPTCCRCLLDASRLPLHHVARTQEAERTWLKTLFPRTTLLEFIASGRDVWRYGWVTWQGTSLYDADEGASMKLHEGRSSQRDQRERLHT